MAYTLCLVSVAVGLVHELGQLEPRIVKLNQVIFLIDKPAVLNHGGCFPPVDLADKKLESSLGEAELDPVVSISKASLKEMPLTVDLELELLTPEAEVVALAKTLVSWL